MSKLQRAVDGQTIQFLSVPKIFNSLSADLPSGAIKLPNGEFAHWRLNRNLTELKKNRKNLKDIVMRLAQTFRSLVNSDAFLNHYGLTKAPEIAAEPVLMGTFRSLLGLNTNRVDYTTITHGRQKPLVETIVVSLGNLVFFNAYRGVQEVPRVDGIKGKLWLNDSADADQCFNFAIVSPVVKLSDYISGDRLAAEILGKIKQNLALIAHNPKIVFADDQFENYVGRGIEQLQAKHEHKTNKPAGEKKQPVLTKVEKAEAQPQIAGYHFALTKEEFAAAGDSGQAEYIHNVSMARNQKDQKKADEVIKAFLLSDILDQQYDEYNAQWAAKHGKITKPYYLAKILGMIDEDVIDLIGASQVKFLIAGVGDVPLEETAAAEAPVLDNLCEAMVQNEGGVAVDVGNDTVMITDPTAEASPGFSYVVKEGDTLFSIAEEAFGNGDLWPNVHLRNKATIEDPTLLVVGQVLVIPERSSIGAGLVTSTSAEA